ncbi:hypothetical protein [Agromyces salentinus]|uniref:Uncharacterized protein n=1 Tax=Agromyces salentinus TaxID=269421 RepID=A0ABN2MRK5_9MICO|nr:hypothetical protein [Agromyces salentinus]
MPDLRPVTAPRGVIARWEVWHDGRRLGWIEQKHLTGARLPFFEAIAPHPRTGKPMSLELHTDHEDRVAVLVEFAEHPERYRQHWS